MPIPFDIRKDSRFIEGFRVGKEEARQELILMREQTYIINMLRTGFGPLELIAELVEVDLDFVHKTQAAYSKTLTLMTKNTTLKTISKKTGLDIEIVERIKEKDGVK
jgi:hypothetical protein